MRLRGIGISLVVLTIGTGCRESVDGTGSEGNPRVDFPESTVDVFEGMDGGVKLRADQIKGRNTWLMWTGGNEAFWDHLARRGYGLVDLLKTLDSRERAKRFSKIGLINEPGFRAASKPDEFGLWLDERIGPEPAGTDPSVDGKSSGIVGLRLFPNPAFKGKARDKWMRKIDPKGVASAYYDNPKFYSDANLARPYRVGMSCAFCHVAPDPLRPPDNPAEPRWENLSSNIGNQYWRTAGVFGSQLKDRKSFVFEILKSANPGTVDTSLLATDGNNNPTAINALFDIGARLERSKQNPAEEIGRGGRLLPPRLASAHVPHILMDGADSIGVVGALTRVYVSIGSVHEQWLLTHNLLVGFRPQSPFRIEQAQRESAYWRATEKRAENLASFLVKVSRSIPLSEAPGGPAFLEKNEAVLARGKTVFAENCFSCHSSKQPKDGAILDPAYLDWARAEVVKSDFLKNNFLSTDQRYPVTLIKTNAGRALADNATRGHVWNDFSSETYKTPPPVDRIDVTNPFDGSPRTFDVPPGGPGYYRPPSLIGLWATAPFLHNNSVGKFTGDPSVAGRMAAFDDAIEKLLWPDKRGNLIARTSDKTWLRIPAASMPCFLEGLTNYRSRLVLVHPWLLPLVLVIVGVVLISRRRRKTGGALVAAGIVLYALSQWLAGNSGDFEIGPIPEGTPVNLLANLNPKDMNARDFLALATKIRSAFDDARELNDEDSRTLLRERLGDDLLRLSKSPDFVEDRGHYFGTRLSDEDKRALIAFLKTL